MFFIRPFLLPATQKTVLRSYRIYYFIFTKGVVILGLKENI